METGIDNTSQDISATPPHRPPLRKHRIRFSIATLLDLLLALAVATVALIPRILLALQLDVVTDEVVYILGGKIYLPLLAHLPTYSKHWQYNYEHPPLVKLLIGSSIALNTVLGHPLRELFAARIPSILFGTLLVVMIFVLGRAPFGRVVALLAALCLAVSPWLVYFSALAYLDMTMTALISIAFLLVWHAIRRPWLYVLIALLVGMATASKYTAVLAIPGMALFTLYYFLGIWWRIPKAERPPIPWLWWLGAILLAPLIFLACDPAIWPNPIALLNHSFHFELEHSIHGHLTFIAGHYVLHVPQWSILYIIAAKMSAFVTIPALLFALIALIQQVRFYWPRSQVSELEASSSAFLLIWMVSVLTMFSLLNIVVGTHYHLPIAAPVALAGAYGLAMLFRYRRGQVFILAKASQSVTETVPATSSTVVATGATAKQAKKVSIRSALVLALLTIMLVAPHLIGLVTVQDAEGYTSEFFQGENSALQVAYPGYREGVQWLAAHTHQAAKIGLISLVATLQTGTPVNWFYYNRDLPRRFTLVEAHPNDYNFPYSYLIWPMHLIQRGYAIPQRWRDHVVHVVMGGKTVYCYVLARFLQSVSP